MKAHRTTLLGLSAVLSTALLAADAHAAGPSGTHVVRDPVTGRTMVVNSDIDPSGGYGPQPSMPSGPPIILHMPQTHHTVRRTHRVARKAPTPKPEETAAQAPEKPAAAPAKPAPEHAARKPPPPPQENAASGSVPFSLSDTPQQPVARIAKAAPPPARTPAPTPAPTPAQTPPSPGAHNVHVNFEPGATQPTPQTAAALKSIAGDYVNELATSSDRLLLEAYAGAPGDKSSDARRLSLKRALAVRQLLIDAGVPSDRIDVRALGGAESGNQDRVDIKMHA